MTHLVSKAYGEYDQACAAWIGARTVQVSPDWRGVMYINKSLGVKHPCKVKDLSSTYDCPLMCEQYVAKPTTCCTSSTHMPYVVMLAVADMVFQFNVTVGRL